MLPSIVRFLKIFYTFHIQKSITKKLANNPKSFEDRKLDVCFFWPCKNAMTMIRLTLLKHIDQITSWKDIDQ